MKNIFKGLAVFILILAANQIAAQTDTVNFTLNSEKINTHGQEVVVASTVKKTGNMLVWNQQTDHGVNAKEFAIVSNSGNWNQELSTGSITYNMVIDELACSFVLTGQQNGLSAVLTISISDTEQREVLIHIDNITYP